MTYTVTQEARDAAQGFGCGFCPDNQSEYLAQAFAKFEAETLERAAEVMDARALMYRKKADKAATGDDYDMNLFELRIGHAEASEYGADEIRALKEKSDE